jgi:hypothetical protein
MSGFFFMMPSTLALYYLVTSLDGWCDGQAFNQQQEARWACVCKRARFSRVNGHQALEMVTKLNYTSMVHAPAMDVYGKEHNWQKRFFQPMDVYLSFATPCLNIHPFLPFLEHN